MKCKTAKLLLKNHSAFVTVSPLAIYHVAEIPNYSGL